MITMYGKTHDGKLVEITHEDRGRGANGEWVSYLVLNINGDITEKYSGYNGPMEDALNRSEADRLLLEGIGIDTQTLKIRRPDEEAAFPPELFPAAA